MFPAARKTDPINHDMITPSGMIGPPLTGPCPMGQVLIEGPPAAHVNCTVVCTGAIAVGLAHPPPPPPTPPPPIVMGSPTVHIHGQFAARWLPSGDAGGCMAQLGLAPLVATRRTFIGGPAGSVTPGAGGQVTATMGGMIVNGTPEDVAEWMSIMAREMRNSQTFHNLTMDMINDTAHPVTFNVGRDNAFFVDSFANNNVDLNDLRWLPSDPPADYPWAQTQGELMTHFIAERRDHVANGNTWPTVHTSPMAPGGVQEQYRQDRGQPGRIVSQSGAADPHNPNITHGTMTDDSGNQTIFDIDNSSGSPVVTQVEHRPATPTPAAPGVTHTSPPP